MLDLSTTSVLCPCNDLESATILDIARRQNIDVHEIKGEWGLSLKDALKNTNNINELKEIVLTIELPPDSLSEQLFSQMGKKLISIDHHGEHWKPLSSLEQFADLIGYELQEKERHIAIADRDWLYGLSVAGVSFEEALKIRQQEYEIQNKAALIEETRKILNDCYHSFDDLAIIFCPEKYCKTMLEVAQFPTSKEKYEENKINPVLIIYHDDLDTKIITQVEFAGEASEKDWIEELTKQDWLAQDFIFWNGGGSYSCFFGAMPKSKYSSISAVNKLVSQILSCTLITGRPLSHYNCTFLLTFDELSDKWQFNEDKIERYQLEDPQKKPKESLEQPESQAYLYFLPQLRNRLVDTKSGNEKEILQHLRLKKENLEGLSLILEGEQPVEVKIEDVSLYYLNKVYVFALKTTPAKMLNNLEWQKDDNTWWRGLFSDRETIKKFQIQTWLRFTKLARVLYLSFIEQVREKKIANVVLYDGDKEIEKFEKGNQLSPVISHLLNLFFKNCNKEKIQQRLQETQTDRMYVNVAYGLAGITPEMKIAKERYERLFSLALYVDEGNDACKTMNGYVYDPEFTQNLMKQDMITRWKGLGVYSGYTIYSNVHFGSSWFFNNVIAPSHVPYIYGHMLVVGLFYQASLRYFAKKVSIATKKLTTQNYEESQKEFRKLREEFIVFTNDYWFRDITDQIQGIEIFEKQTKSLRLNEEYILIKDEMERADEYMETLRKESFDQKTKLISGIAAVLGVAAVWASTLAAPTETFPSIFEFNRFNVAFAFSLCCSVVAIYLSFRKK